MSTENQYTPASSEGGGEQIARHSVWARLALVVAILAVGVVGQSLLGRLKKEPPVREVPKVVASATGIVGTRQNVQSVLYGYGTARPHRTTMVVPEVEGRVVEVHPRLEEGKVIEKGDVLFRIDPTDYELAREQSLAEVAQIEQEIEQLAVEEKSDAQRLELARQNLALAQRDLDRVDTLVQSGGAESEARLDQVRGTVTQRQDQVVALERTLALYPTRRGMLEARLKSARARVDLAAANIERTTVRAPYDARIVKKSIELDQRVAPGMEALLLADDSILEIPVSLDGFELSRWLEVERDPADLHWVGKFAKHPVTVEWSDDKSDHPYVGRLDRIESYNSDTRTFHVIVAIDATHFDPNASAPFPLTDGMFCEVAIPGRIARDVIPVPRDAVDSNSTVLISEDGKLRTRPVEIVRYQQDVALIASGIEDKAIVLTSRPPRVIDGMNLEVSLLDASAVIQEEGRPIRPGDEPAAAAAGSNSTARTGLENL
ncbi:MAG: hypothetical protein PWP23_1312 [Candidatus Sumerlaeota bacterium]|nr:hypothetical protein [Candidatus Sumerlaeota bacterium]